MSDMISSPKPRRARSKLRPLSYERLAILLAAAKGPMDRPRLVEQVQIDTVTEVVLKTSSAYFLISELAERGFLSRQGSRYELTGKGWRALHNELDRIEQQRLILKQRLHI